MALTREKLQWLYRLCMLIALATLTYLLGWSENSLLPRWAENKPKCHIPYSLPASYGLLSNSWKLRPDFVWRADLCSSNLRLSQQQTDDDSSYLIPRIIHQVFDSDSVPELYVNWSRSWLEVNRGWQHWFWTFSDVRELLARHYPAHLKLWEDYPSPIYRADATKYFVIHHYGGFFLDLDYQALRPMDLWAQRYRCIFSEEPYEHVFLLQGKSSAFVSTAFLGCSPGHPALSSVLDRLNITFQQLKSGEIERNFRYPVLATTGPFMLDSVLKSYTENLQKRRVLTTTESCVDSSITVAPPSYFQPVYCDDRSPDLREICNGTMSSKELGIVCTEVRRNNFSSQVNPIAYGVHWWHSSWLRSDWQNNRRVNYSTSIPGIKTAGQFVSTTNETNVKSVDWCM